MKPVSRDGVLIPMCPYCMVEAVLHPLKIPHLGLDTYRWECPTPGCDARVGVNQGSRRHAPLGTLAREPRRQARWAAHDAFDPLWRGPNPMFPSRKRAYSWLADRMDLPFERTHIAEFDEAQCARVVAICAHAREVPR